MPEHDWESQAYGWTEYFADHPVRPNPKDQEVIQHIEDTSREVGSVSMAEVIEPPKIEASHLVARPAKNFTRHVNRHWHGRHLG